MKGMWAETFERHYTRTLRVECSESFRELQRASESFRELQRAPIDDIEKLRQSFKFSKIFLSSCKPL